MPLPNENSKEWKEEVNKYVGSTIEYRNKRSKELGYKDRNSFQTVMERRGIGVGAVDKEDKDGKIELPPVKISEYKPTKTKNGDEETQVVLLSDGHAGKITQSFNKITYQKRMETVFQSIVTIANLHRHMYPINKLRIIDLGDNCQGENPHQGSVVGEIEMGARDQTIKIATPAWNDLLGSLKQHFSEVIFDGFPGNHGYEKFAPETSREDLRLYDILQVGIGREKGITINIHEQFADIIDIEGYKFFCFHGDGIPCQQGVPQMAIERRLKSWYIQYGGFNYACGAHFHKRLTNEIAAGVEYFMNASLVSDDMWALKKLGISSQPSQWTFGVHSKRGITWRYPLIVDYKFLPLVGR